MRLLTLLITLQRISYGLDGQGFESQQGREHFFSRDRRDGFWGTLSPIFIGYQGYFSGVKRLVFEVDHSPQSTAEVKNDWNYTQAPGICFLGVDRDSLPVPYVK